MLFSTLSNSTALVEYSDSSDWQKTIRKNLSTDKNYTIDLKNYGWDRCDIRANKDNLITANCYTANKNLIIFDCHPLDESISVYISDSTGTKMTRIKLVCKY
jgi:hypothetical protein